MRFNIIWILCLLFVSYSLAEPSIESPKKSLTDIFRACISESVQEGEVQFKKPQTGHPFLFLSCGGSVAKEFHNLVKLYKIYDDVQKIPKEFGGGFMESIYFGQITTSHLSSGQIHRIKTNSEIDCHKISESSDGANYNCQIDLSNEQIYRTKADPGSNCHKTYKISDGKIIDESYGCLIQIDLYSNLVRDLAL